MNHKLPDKDTTGPKPSIDREAYGDLNNSYNKLAEEYEALKKQNDWLNGELLRVKTMIVKLIN